uniref:Uncharacterized protein n=1 Tax=viral metagenome TaxID=1070528 RepID=A0A6M3JN37_9ZZZZ
MNKELKQFDKELKKLLTDFTAKNDFNNVEDFIEFILYNMRPHIKTLLKAQRDEIIEKIRKQIKILKEANSEDNMISLIARLHKNDAFDEVLEIIKQ